MPVLCCGCGLFTSFEHVLTFWPEYQRRRAKNREQQGKMCSGDWWNTAVIVEFNDYYSLHILVVDLFWLGAVFILLIIRHLAEACTGMSQS